MHHKVILIHLKYLSVSYTNYINYLLFLLCLPKAEDLKSFIWNSWVALMGLQVLSNSGTLVFLNDNEITFSALHVLQIFVLLCYKESYVKERKFLGSIFKTWENKPVNKWVSMAVWVGTTPRDTGFEHLITREWHYFRGLRRCDLVGIDVVLVEEVSHRGWAWRFQIQIIFVQQVLLTIELYVSPASSVFPYKFRNKRMSNVYTVFPFEVYRLC